MERTLAPEPGLAVTRWAASGAMDLTGRSSSPPLGPPARLVANLEALAAPFPDLDALALLGERAAVAELERGGETSCGGGSRLLRARDGWLAISLPRPDDVDAVPAWLERDDLPSARGWEVEQSHDATGGPGADLWSAVAGVVAQLTRDHVVERGILLDLAVAALPDQATRGPDRSGVLVRTIGAAPPQGRHAGRVDLSGVLVVDLSSLWAGPLCGALLADLGADVVKVESTRRPDGARRGPRPFFDLLNGAKRSVALDLDTAQGAHCLADLLGRADVVIEASRPRALIQLGIDAAALVATGPKVWVSITGHGREGEWGHRVAFGDDAAVAGGLFALDTAGPVFCADAVADPLTGVAAARSAIDALARGDRVILDVAMAAVAAEHAGPTLPVPPGTIAAPPTARSVRCRAPDLGADTAAVLAGSLP